MDRAGHGADVRARRSLPGATRRSRSAGGDYSHGTVTDQVPGTSACGTYGHIRTWRSSSWTTPLEHPCAWLSEAAPMTRATRLRSLSGTR